MAETTLTIDTVKGKQEHTGDAGPFLLAMVQGSEGISMPFCYDVTMYRSEDLPEVDARDLINTSATLGFRVGSGDWLYRQGMIQSMQKAGTTNVRHEAQTNYFVYNARIVPAFKMLDNEVTFRVFEKKTLSDIFKEIITGFPGIASASYVDTSQLSNEDLPQLEYCVQFGESSYNFLSRLMAQLGIWYMFEHRYTSAQAVNETMVLGRSLSLVQQCGKDQMTVVLYDADDDKIAPFSRNYHPAHHHVWVGDFNTLLPTAPVGADTDVEATYDLQPNEPKPDSRFLLERFPRPILNEASNGIQKAADQDAAGIISAEEAGVFLAQGQSKNKTFVAGRTFQVAKDETGAAGKDKNYLLAALSFSAVEHTYGHTTGWDILNLLGDLSWKLLAPDGDKPGKKVVNVFAGLAAQGLNNYLQNEAPYAIGNGANLPNNGGASKPYFWPFVAGGMIASGTAGLQLLVDRVDHVIDRHDDDYGNAFIAIPWDPGRGQWRFPLPLAATPIAYGPHLATVIGHDGAGKDTNGHIYTNKDGQVRIRFQWQRTVPPDGTASVPVSPGSDTDPFKSDRRTCWVRVSEGWAGGQYGTQFLPRIGDEVIVSFIDGDPSRPIVTGRVYNGVSLHPFDLNTAANQTRSGIKTQTTPKSADDPQRFHLVRFDDAPDKEQLLLRSQKRLDITALGNRYETIGNNRNLTVGWIDTKHEVAGGDHINKIYGDYHLHVGDPAGPFNGGHRYELVENDYDLEVKKETNFKLDGDWNVTVGGKASISADTIVLKAVKSITLTVGNSTIVLQADGIYNEAAIHYEQCGASGQQAADAVVQAPKDPTQADPGTS
jgi:uncharacterized protein involved in type VI secretion and phage assembly